MKLISLLITILFDQLFMRVVCFLKGDVFINNTFIRSVPIFGIFSTIFKYSQIFTNLKNWGTLPL